MKDQPTLNELTAFTAIVRHGSFRAAADELGLSASTLSHMTRSLEERLGVRLLNRTTRSVAPTDAGSGLVSSLVPLLADLETALSGVDEFRQRPSGRLRITATEIAIELLMQEIVPVFAARYPEIHLELVSDSRLIDIVAEGFDAGVRYGESVPRDMVGVPFGGDAQFLAVASPAYLARHGIPQTPDDLARHQCLRMRLGSGRVYRWEFERHDQELKLEVNGPMTLDHIPSMITAAIKGLGIAYVPSHAVLSSIEQGALVAVLAEWTPPFPGQYLYYPSHRLVPPRLRAFVDIVQEIGRRHSG